MRTAEYDGRRYLLLKSSGDSSLLRDPETGEERYLPNHELTITGDSPLVVAANLVPEPQRKLLTAVHSELVLGLLIEIDRSGPLSARELLSRYDLCESDLHGKITGLRVSGLIREADVNGERGYAVTELASEALESLR